MVISEILYGSSDLRRADICDNTFPLSVFIIVVRGYCGRNWTSGRLSRSRR